MWSKEGKFSSVDLYNFSCVFVFSFYFAFKKGEYDIFMFLYDYLEDQPHLRQEMLDASVILGICTIGHRQGFMTKKWKIANTMCSD